MMDHPPTPGRIAGLPRDERGYPVPAENAWTRGRPHLALQDYRRSGALYAHGACAICGLTLTLGEPLYRLFADDEVGPTLAENACRRYEGPGHRECMIFSGAVCPFFATSGARRTQDRHEVPKGTQRGATAALIGFATVQIAIDQSPPHPLLFLYRDVVEQVTFTKASEIGNLLTTTDPPQGAASIRQYWKTEPEVKRAWGRTIDLARKLGTPG
jgi:hypothetical protein